MNVGTKVTSFIDESVQSINKNRQLAKLSGVLSKTRTITNSDVTLYDYDSGEVIFLAITGSSDITVTLPAPDPKKTGLNFTFINALTPSGTGDAVIVSDGGNDTIVTQSTGGTNTAATATVTITDYTEINNGDNLKVMATDLTSYNFVAGDQSSVNGTFEATTSNNATAANLMNVINTSSGPSGTRFSASVVGAVVTITQNTAGADGNTTIVLTDSGTAGIVLTASFTGGYSGADNLLADNITVEAASVGGEWIEFISDGSFWYSKVSKSGNTAISMNG